MNVVEIFSSIDGEGQRQGFLTTFLRLYDCNLRCIYCDTPYSYDGSPYETMTIPAVVETIKSLNNYRITITGGEPLLQEEAIHALAHALACKGRYDINIETNGSIIPSWRHSSVWYTFDYKLPGSGFESVMNLDIFPFSTERDIIKFVVSSEEDLHRMADVIRHNPTEAQLYVSPVWGAIDGARIVEFMREEQLQNVRLQLQMHKFIWSPDAKGV